MEKKWEDDPAVLAGWLNLKEASVSYGVSIYQIRRWLLAGAIPAGRLPTRTGWIWRIRPPVTMPDQTMQIPTRPVISTDIETALAAAEADLARLRILLRAYEQQTHTTRPAEALEQASDVEC